MSKDNILVSPEKIYVKDYKQLLAYKKSVEMEDCIFELCKKFPVDEKYRYCDQILRSSSSISANICEGLHSYIQKNTFHS